MESVEPARVETIADSKVSRVTLTAQAAERLGIETVPVQEQQAAAGDKPAAKVVPYAAVLYDLHGDAWTYTNPSPYVYVRHPVAVDRIEGDLAVLSDGPSTGTAVVTVGAAELYGAESGLGR